MLVDLVAIGIDNYFDFGGRIIADQALRFAASDAGVLLRTFAYLFDLRNGTLLTDGPSSKISPTRNSILRSLQQICEIKTEDMTPLFVYFAGHGIGVDGILHLCPSDYDAEIREHSSVDVALVCEMVSRRHGKTCLIFDCCRTSLNSPHSSKQPRLPRVTVPVGEELIMVMGCRDGQWSYESEHLEPHGGGVFTNQIVSALHSMAKTSAQGYFSLAEVFHAARDNTVQYVFDKTGYALQKPVALGGDLDEFFINSKVKSNSKSAEHALARSDSVSGRRQKKWK
jgi:uncharacterized caspase-like protein